MQLHVRSLSLLSLSMLLMLSCGGDKSAVPFDICGCIPASPESSDFRHAEKHIPLTASTPSEITVDTLLGWPVDTALLVTSAPRAGRELQMFQIESAYVQAVNVEAGDCDVHFEISNVPAKNAPRVIVETPVDSEYCVARQETQQALRRHGIDLSPHVAAVEIDPPLKAQVTGLAFEDFAHSTRGSVFVATQWEIHPAMVKFAQ